MTSSADREPPPDANPYQSPTHSGWADDPIAFLQQLPGGAIEVRGSLQPQDVFWGHFDSPCGFIEFAITQFIGFAVVLAAATGLFIALLTVIATRPAEPAAWLAVAGIEAVLLLLLRRARRDWLSAKHLRQLWNQRRGIFADQVRRVTADGILSTSADERTETPWADYAHYRLAGKRLRLHLRRNAQERRRAQRPEGGILWKAGTRWYDGIDIFPREQFASREEWKLFVRLVKEKLYRR